MTAAATNFEVHDFRQPRQLLPTSWRTLQRWSASGCKLVGARWRKLGLDVTLTPFRARVLLLRSALELIPEPAWGGRGVLGGPSIDTLVACPPARIRSLVSRMLGDTPDDSLEVSSLTAFEESIAELLIAEFLKGFAEAWPGAEPLNCGFLATVPQPQRTRMYPPGTPLVVMTLQVLPATAENRDSDGSASGPSSLKPNRELIWMIPQLELEELIEAECSAPAAPPRTAPHPAIPRIMREVPVPVIVELGRADLSMSELTSLQSGDVVVLEQSVQRPLNVRVGDVLKFRGRPGRIGTQRCLEIQQILEDAPEPLAPAAY